jgi:micrococcal nuclease
LTGACTGRRRWRRVLPLFLLIVARAASADPPPPAGPLRATVVRVVDGDTVRVRRAGREEPVRLIGVDTPEAHESDKLDREVRRSRRSRASIVALGRAAAAYTTRRLLGQTVGLELDTETHDRYGRLLAYVWLDDGTLFNAALLRDGYALPLTIAPNVRYTTLFRTLAGEAQRAGRGLWARGMTLRRQPRSPRAMRISRSSRENTPKPSSPSDGPTCTAHAPLARARRTS